MQNKLPRRKIAEYAATRITAGDPVATVLDEVAAYLLESGRVREQTLVVRAIEDALARAGEVVANVTTARPLNTGQRAEVKKLIGAQQVHLREVVNPDVLGGVCIETPGAKLDATLQRKILALRRAKQ